VLADGLSWRRASDPSFNTEAALPHVLHMVHCLLVHPQAPSPSLLRLQGKEEQKEGSGQ
jgi:hypothetical protein